MVLWYVLIVVPFVISLHATDSSLHGQVKSGRTYETLDSLLLNSSPAFMQRMSDRLMEKLIFVRKSREDEVMQDTGEGDGHAAEK